MRRHLIKNLIFIIGFYLFLDFTLGTEFVQAYVRQQLEETHKESLK